MSARRPPALRPGSRIRIVAPAGAVSRARLEESFLSLKSLGFVVSLGDHLWQRQGYLAGSDAMRAHDLELALTDDAIDGVFLARGGWGTMRSLALVDVQRVAGSRPKVVLGYSDITALHAFLERLGWVTFHGPMAEADWQTFNGQEALRILQGGSGLIGSTALEHLCQGSQPSAEICAPFVGGNLSVVCSLLKTPFEIAVADRVLYLEEVNEPPYRIDRMMTQLRLAGILNRARAVVFGEATNCRADPELEDYSAKDVVVQQCQAAGVDLFWGLAAGHGPVKWTLPLSWPLTIENGWVRLEEPSVI